MAYFLNILKHQNIFAFKNFSKVDKSFSRKKISAAAPTNNFFVNLIRKLIAKILT